MDLILPITSGYATLLIALLLILTLRVIDLRGSPATAWLHKQPRQISDEALQRAIRGHGNLCEYLAAFLVLLALCELNQLPLIMLHASGLMFCVGRFMHGIGFAFTAHSPTLRIGGMVFTLLSFILLLVALSYRLFSFA